ncbi:siderophore synthetase component [Herbaspirillum sp. CF444]|uniref:IucA/IucC family protein n=1 Tax=Herbaspirillum sp. CF444 TaxID=1144319 RepID=UPI0002725E1E|nr:IucA/IucC family protein [Herbaspirillum sp. CF444]EJL82857.1 siderophore synthetase component [Herbaspirillum sp. CF444]
MPIPLRQEFPRTSDLPHPCAPVVALLQDLIDALWLEQLYDFRRHCSFAAAAGTDRQVLRVSLGDGRRLQFAGSRLDGLRPFRLAAQAPVLLTAEDDADGTPLSAEATVVQLQSAAWWQDRSGRFLHFFLLSQQQALDTAACEPAIAAALQQAPAQLLHWERLSCLKDRPFHPLARAKDWGGDDQVAAYLPTAMTPFALTWIAAPRTRLRSTADHRGQPLAAAVLDAAQLTRLHRAAQDRQADGDAWLWLPVHPWQWRTLQAQQSELITDCILLGNDFGCAAPTASLRSLALPQHEHVHLKLALSVNTLGAIRTLPPRYLHNADAAAACLETLKADDPWLAAHLQLCDESQWWARSTGNMDDADDAEFIRNRGELACLVRRYPALPQRLFIPMAALPACLADGALPAFDYLLGVGDAGAEQAWKLFGDIAALLIGLGLRCVAKGVMPELHGQNVLLVCRGAEIEALLLRDHDTLRICPPQLRRHGLGVPAYRIDRSTPNTLELDGIEELLAYFQTLAIEVNLYAVLAALAQRHGDTEARGWRIVRDAITAALAEVSMAAADTALLRKRLLEQEQWPFKQVLAPLLERESFGTGMPSKMGTIANPLLNGAD